MSTWFTAWFALAGIVTLGFLNRLRSIGISLRKRLVLTSTSLDDSGVSYSCGSDVCSAQGPARAKARSSFLPPKVSVLVAAKDEEEVIETCVRTLMDQDYPNYEVIVADDRSEDHTPQILQSLKEEFGDRLKAITITSLREGWFGKNNAMREAVEAATGEWFMFTDADCRQTSNRTLSLSMQFVTERETDFLSITPALDCEALWEKIIQPACVLVLIAWFQPRQVNRRSKKVAYANGAFMLVRRKCYEAIGGHERVRTELNEDIFLARHAKNAGFRLRVVENDDLYRVRMYKNVRQAWWGWSRIYAGCLGSIWKLGVTVLVVILFLLMPWVSLTASLTGLTMGVEPARQWAWMSAVWALNVVLLHYTAWRLYSVLPVNRRWSVLFPVGSTAVVTMLIHAVLKVAGLTRTTWRGTSYRGQAVETSSPLSASGTVATQDSVVQQVQGTQT